MVKRVLYIIIISLLTFKTVLAQEDNGSKWSITGGVTPHFTSNYGSVFLPHPGLEITTQYTFEPAIYFNACYKPFKHLSLQAGIGYNIYNTPIIELNPYLEEYENDYEIHSGEIANAIIQMLELPGTINYYILDKKKYGLYISVGDISSFMIAKTYFQSGLPIKGVQTTIYQNYLQFAFGFELKAKPRWSFYASPLYRIALVNYHDTVHYDIYAYPNVFYDRMLGMELGARYHFLKKKAVSKG